MEKTTTPIVHRLIDRSDRPDPNPDGYAGAAIAVRASAELVEGERKRARVAHEYPKGSEWEIVSDEGTAIGGEDRAPEPLTYLAAAGAFCVLTQMSQYAKAHKLEVDEMRVEQTFFYEQSGAWLNGTRHGRAFKVTNVIDVDSKESADTVEAMIRTAEQACFVEQSLISAVPISTRVVHNGQPVAELSIGPPPTDAD